MLTVRPELVGMDGAGGDERRALHYAVMRRSAPMVKLLMEAGAGRARIRTEENRVGFSGG